MPLWSLSDTLSFAIVSPSPNHTDLASQQPSVPPQCQPWETRKKGGALGLLRAQKERRPLSSHCLPRLGTLKFSQNVKD